MPLFYDNNAKIRKRVASVNKKRIYDNVKCLVKHPAFEQFQGETMEKKNQRETVPCFEIANELGFSWR